ncbi:MAG TPA: prepilin peptidase [Desulfobacteraceae bacterium]|nr:prepilin peptidase [Desulfobacteraceae bacterium]
MDLSSFMLVYSALIGLALGSFINVCIYRIPLKKSIVSPPSSCPNCGERIKFYDNIPLVSYVLLLGKCRYCRHPISWRYPAVEALTGMLSMALFTRYGFNYQYIIFLLFTASLVTVSFIDLRHQIIPDIISIPGIAAGLAYSFIPGNVSWTGSLIGIIVGGGGLYLIAGTYKLVAGKEGMGGGDIKLLSMIGAWMGWRALLFIVLISSLSGAITGSVFLLLAGKGLRVKIPFGPFLSLGAMFYLFFGVKLTELYLQLICHLS